ncbi:SRPBCC domain-containing protein [Brachybacterium sp. DNPG3]
MTPSPASQLRDVRRRVLTEGGGSIVALDQELSAAAVDVWAALTDPDRLASWFLRPTGTLREGGRFALAEMGVSGRIVRADHPLRLVLTWESAGMPGSEVEVVLGRMRDRTRLSLLHHLPHDEHWATYGPAATGCGWEGALFALVRHLADPEVDQQQALAGWATSPEAAQFTRDTAAAWAEADIIGGADPETARARAARTAAAYLGEQPAGDPAARPSDDPAAQPSDAPTEEPPTA